MSGLLVVDKLSRGKALVRVVATPAVRVADGAAVAVPASRGALLAPEDCDHVRVVIFCPNGHLAAAPLQPPTPVKARRHLHDGGIAVRRLHAHVQPHPPPVHRVDVKDISAAGILKDTVTLLSYAYRTLSHSSSVRTRMRRHTSPFALLQRCLNVQGSSTSPLA